MHPTFAKMNQYVDMSSKEGTDHKTYTLVRRERERENEKEKIHIYSMERERKLNKIIAKNDST